MNRFMRWYNKNRKIIWKVIAIVVIIIGVIQLINYFYRVQNEKELSSTNNQIQNTAINNDYNSVTVGEDFSSLTGEKISSEQEIQIGIIDQFINYCNENSLQDAYDLLTDECKEEMYPNLEAFQQSYYNNIFGNSRKNVSVESWIKNIYKVKINEDFLSTGKYSKEDTIQDYITVVELDNDEYKLNINGYVGREQIEKSKESNDIIMEVEKTDIYMNYQIYKLKVTNNKKTTIVLDDGADIDAIYIEDDNGVKYSAYTHELNEGQITISSRETKELEVKYYSKYGSKKEINKLVFSRMILNKEAYTIFQDKSLYRDYGFFEVEI